VCQLIYSVLFFILNFIQRSCISYNCLHSLFFHLIDSKRLLDIQGLFEELDHFLAVLKEKPELYAVENLSQKVSYTFD